MPRSSITVQQADRLIRRCRYPFPSQRVPLDTAAGRILHETVRANRPFPPYDRVMMDGIAVSFAAWQRGQRVFKVEGVQQPGRPPQRRRRIAGCFEVMTGAVLPGGCDCVVPVEELTIANGQASIKETAKPVPRQYIHPAGSDARRGEVMLRPGRVLDGPAIAVAASLGKRSLRVQRLVRVHILSTGDELLAVTALRRVRPHEVYRSNPHALAASLNLQGRCEVTHSHATDDPRALGRALRLALRSVDLLLLTGGVSRGRYDHVPDLLQQARVNQVFHRVRQRPGGPLWFGQAPRGQPVFGLPGNPVSCLVCLQRYVIPLLDPGFTPLTVRLASRMARQSRTLFQAVRLCENQATAVILNTSGDLVRLAGSDGFVELPAGNGYLRRGSNVRYWSWK